jgi:hypothetical protein
MSCARQQALIEASPEAVWDLLGDPRRHPEWWPRVLETHVDEIAPGCTYRQITKGPVGTLDTEISLDRLESCREVLIRCLDTGTYNRWLLTEAGGGTFVDAEFGMDPKALGNRIFDTIAGRRYFRSWLANSIEALGDAAAPRAAASADR